MRRSLQKLGLLHRYNNDGNTHKRFLSSQRHFSSAAFSSSDPALLEEDRRYHKETLDRLLVDDGILDENTWRQAESSLQWLVTAPNNNNNPSPSPNPSYSLNLLERLKQQKGKHNNFQISSDLQCKILEQVVQSKNKKLLERAETIMNPYDDDLLRFFLVGWAQFPNGGSERACRMLLESSSSPILSSYRLLLNVLAKEGNYVRAGQLLQQLLLLNNNNEENLVMIPDRECFHSVLRACAKNSSSGAVEAAEGWFSQMKQYASRQQKQQQPQRQPRDIEPSISTYRLILQCLAQAKNNQPETGRRAYDLLQELEQPDQLCYNITLNALAKEGNYDLAQQLLVRLVENSKNNKDLPSPDLITIRTVLKAYSKANTFVAAERAERLLRTMAQLTKLQPDARVYATVIGIWAKLGQAERARALLEELETIYSRNNNNNDPNLKPDQICYQTVIGCISKVEPQTETTARQAQHLLDKLQEMGYAPNLVTCNTVLNCWAKATLPDHAKHALHEMATIWRVTPDIVSYNTVIHPYARLGQVEQVQQLLDELIQNEHLPTPNTRTFTAMMLALSKQKTPQAAERAEGLLLQMQEFYESRQWDTNPNVITYNAVLNCWAAQGAGPRARAILEEMQQLHSKEEQPNVISYNTVIHAYSNDFQTALSLAEEMVERGITPNDSTHHTLLKILAKDRRVTNKEAQKAQIQQRFLSRQPRRGRRQQQKFKNAKS